MLIFIPTSGSIGPDRLATEGTFMLASAGGPKSRVLFLSAAIVISCDVLYCQVRW